jgi:hypothetical protein
MIGGLVGRWAGRWKKLTPGERLRTQAIIACVLVGMYVGVFYQISHKKYKDSINMIHRRQDRIKKRADIGNLGGGPSPQALKQQIEKVNGELAALKEGLNELDSGFVPLDSTEMRQQLMLEISTLAERTGVELLSVARKGFSPEKVLGELTVDPVLGRPLLEVKANTDFGRLLDFLHGLKDLSFYVAVMKLNVYSRHLQEGTDKRGNPVRLPPGAITVSMELSI